MTLMSLVRSLSSNLKQSAPSCQGNPAGGVKPTLTAARSVQARKMTGTEIIMSFTITALIISSLGNAALAENPSGPIKFEFKSSQKNMITDVNAIWTPQEIKDVTEPTNNHLVINEWQADTKFGTLIVSQFYSSNCGMHTCPTRLALIVSGKPPKILVEEELHQARQSSSDQIENATDSDLKAYLKYPFSLSADARVLFNGDLSIPVTSLGNQ